MPDESEFTSGDILDFIREKNNIPVLEHLLGEYYPKIGKIGKINPSSDKINSKTVLEAIISDSKSIVDSFLGTDEKMPDTSFYSIFRDVDEYKIPLLELYTAGVFGAGASIFEMLSGNVSIFPLSALVLSAGSIVLASKYRNKLSAHSFFTVNNSKITLRKANEVDITLDFAHEYTHYLQLKSGIMERFSEHFFGEGHAIGVEREIGREYSEKTGNDEYLRKDLIYSLRHLNSVYSWACEKLNKRQKPSSYFMPASDLREEILKRPDLGTPSNHAVGNAFFLIKELTHGTGIYKDAVHGNFDFLR